MKFARRTFAWTMIGAFGAWCQSRPKRLTEDDEWDEAFDLSRRVRSDRPPKGIVPNAETATRIAEAA